LFFGITSSKTLGQNSDSHHSESKGSETAIDILKKRYAKGEITKEEFDQMKNDL
jgi:putative membrane protein